MADEGKTVEPIRAPQPGEVWEEADGVLLYRAAGFWLAFGQPVHDDDPVIEHPLRRRFTEAGEPVSNETLRYPGGHAVRVLRRPQ